MTDWTTPRTWTSEVLTSPLLNTHVRDNLNHLYEKSIPILIPGLQGHGGLAGLGGAGTNEEYGTTTTGLSWSPSAPTTVDSNTTIPNHLYMSVQGDSTERLGTKAWSAAGAFSAYTCMMIGSNSSTAALSPNVSLHIGNSDNSLRVALLLQYTCSTGASAVSGNTYASSTYTQRGSQITVPSGIPIYFQIMRDGSNNVNFFWSSNGRLWNFIATQSFTFTVANIGFRTQGNGVGFQVGADFLRTSV